MRSDRVSLGTADRGYRLPAAVDINDESCSVHRNVLDSISKHVLSSREAGEVMTSELRVGS